MGTLMQTAPKTGWSALNNLPTFFDDFLTRDLFDWTLGNRTSTSGTLPAVNIRETNDSYELEVAAPGMKKNDFTVELVDDMLVISADVKNEDVVEDKDYTRREFWYQSFQRAFRLPENMVESDKISASYHDGILHITVPKSEEAKTKPPKKIKVV